MHRVILICISILCMSVLSACDNRPVARKYVEITREPLDQTNQRRSRDPHAGLRSLDEMKKMPVTDIGDSKRSQYTWTIPEEWKAIDASGLRIASFVNKTNKNEIDCSIVQLGGRAGGIEGNVLRWMRQVEIDIPDQKALGAFIQKQKTISLDMGGSALLINLTELQEQNAAMSMIAAIIEIPEGIVFIKMTGSVKSILKNKKPFLQLIKSFLVKK